MPFDEALFKRQMSALYKARGREVRRVLLLSIRSHVMTEISYHDKVSSVMPVVISSDLCFTDKKNLMLELADSLSRFYLVHYVADGIQRPKDKWYYFLYDLLSARQPAMSVNETQKVSKQWFSKNANGVTARDLFVLRTGCSRLADALSSRLKKFIKANSAAPRTVSSQAGVQQQLRHSANGAGAGAGAVARAFETRLSKDAPEFIPRKVKLTGSGLLSGRGKVLEGETIWTKDQARALPHYEIGFWQPQQYEASPSSAEWKLVAN
jgi:hypothetical protein